MSNLPPSADAQGYLENLMRVGQDAMKQFDSALFSTMGVSDKTSPSSSNPLFPFTLFANLQREYFKHLWQFWNAVFLKSFDGGAHSGVGSCSAWRTTYLTSFPMPCATFRKIPGSRMSR